MPASSPAIFRPLQRHEQILDIVKLLLLGAGVFWLLMLGEEHLNYQWQWYLVPRYIFTWKHGVFTPGPLLEGLFVTFQITGLSLVLSMLFGLTAAIFGLSQSYVARLVSRCYVELIRNTPLLIQILFIYFVIAPVFDIGAFTSAVLALSLFEGAYASEIFRGGIESIHKGQWEAAYSLGLSTTDTYRKIILPQAIKRILPPLTGVLVSLVKDSSLASTIAVYELTQQGQLVIADTFLTFEIWFLIAIMYLAVTISLSWAAAALERKMNSEN
ncbi:amino acid ABC transporter permease [Desulfobaculum bizertense]|uniref:Putative glutamine transport system permease protein GlnP n=1 Tax=Desulfobaculum bizertense DSM 18034 TaxID=1121442 RepID=A0A1T4VF24_9BACT|nr:amino acid ABC transporter permease [Desulfobaculum bizertense]SKA63584.1 amino acid ABC transporter membrane protein 1, PAAT family [Desulfobaculum bizertense DSM 18034]